MKKRATRAFSLVLAVIMTFCMSTWVFAEESDLVMQNANSLSTPSNAAEIAERGNFLPYNGYFEESFTSGVANGRKVRLYIPEGARLREYYVALALPSGTDIDDFLKTSGWIDVADDNNVCLMILMPNNDQWGTYAQEYEYVNYVMKGAGSARRWYSLLGLFYVAGYGDGGDLLQEWTAENPLFIISQAYFDSSMEADALAAAGEFYYTQGNEVANSSQTASDQYTFATVQKKDIPVPTLLVGNTTTTGVINYWKNANESEAGADQGAGPLGADLFLQNKDINSRAIATSFNDVVSQVAVLDSKTDYKDPDVSREVYEFLSLYTRYDNTCAWGNALVL